MNLIYKKTAIIAVLLASTSTFAGGTTQSATTQSALTESTQSLSQEKHLQWGISVQEYARYEELMKGMRGSVSPDTISPIEVLGIHAKNDIERKKYARIWADMMEKDAERILAFQRAYDEAWREKGNKNIIDISQIRSEAPETPSPRNTAPMPSSVQTMLLATRLDGCESCDKKIQQLLTSMLLDKSIQLDIYFSDSSDKENGVIRQWAMKNNISADMLRSRRITLNHGQSLMQQYQLEEGRLPVLFKIDSKGGVKRVE